MATTPKISFEESIQVTQLSPDTFQPAHPLWTWPNSAVVPGGCLMSLAAASCYRTLPSGYALDNLHCQFLSGSIAAEPYTAHVTRLTDGKRFRVRSVVIKQNNRNIASLTLAFMNATPWTGPSMRHTVSQAGKARIAQITIDDLERGRGRNGGFMRFQRLPLIHQPSQQPHTSLAPVVAHILGPLAAPAGTIPHILGLLNISDYHVLGAAPALHGLSNGLPAIGDESGVGRQMDFSMYTSLNHTVHIHSHDFRADELLYIEVTSPWTGDGRGLMHSRIFSGRDGRLLASCTQEAYYVLKEGERSEFTSKL